MIPLRRVNEIPSTLNTGAIDRALKAYSHDNHLEETGTDLKGFLQQLTDAIAATLVFKNAPHVFVWLAEDEGEVIGWALTHVEKGVDNTLCYWMTDAWVNKDLRCTGWTKRWNEEIQTHAKQLMCKHLLVASSRGNKGYCRFLGEGWHPYLQILKKDI